ncbi:G5 domain-containing protein [Actinoplanes sp. URMC 104]|uniref:G5 domain-containing protein n=1 Tax=Actinoplanes sp. URMC 104 TaxID=3423409 RepID=UPI003F1B9826
MTYQTPMWPGQPPKRAGFWQRLSPVQRAGLVVAALILPCCGGLAVIGAVTGGDAKTETVTGAGNNLAEVEPLGTTAAAPTSPTAVEATPESTAALAPASAAATTAAVVRKTLTEQARIPYKTRRVEDDSLAEGKTRVRTKGVAGIRTITYEVTYTGGRVTARRVVRTVVTRKPVTKVVAVGTRSEPKSECDPNYSGCVPIASDVDCAGGDGNGPEYVSGPIRVIGDDPYDLDRDGDGIACDK